MHYKKISIITVVYNGENSIEKTINSIINQSYPHKEYIIIDGGSSDETLNIIKAYEKNIDYWISEPDKGIYDAMNKGIRASTGDGLLFINSGDYLVGEVITDELLIPCFLPVRYRNFFGNDVTDSISTHKLGLPLCHQGIVFENKGIYYNTNFEIAADYDFFLKNGYDETLPKAEVNGFVYYDNTGFSAINFTKRDQEIKQIIEDHFGNAWALLFGIKSSIKKIIKQVSNVF